MTDDASSTVVPLLVYFADKVAGHDPAPGYVQDEVALVPQASLAANKTFRVDISAVVKGAPTIYPGSSPPVPAASNTSCSTVTSVLRRLDTMGDFPRTAIAASILTLVAGCLGEGPGLSLPPGDRW